jgi:hypothetical protein
MLLVDHEQRIRKGHDFFAHRRSGMMRNQPS